MAPTPITVGLFVAGLVLVSVVGVWLMLRLDDSPADREVARGGAKAVTFREDVRGAAAEFGWRIEDCADLTFPASLRPRRAEPGGCEFAVDGDAPRAFRAETWAMKHRNAGAGFTSSFLQHRVTMSVGVARPRFAVSGDDNWQTMLATIPDDLVGRGRTVAGLTIYGDDAGLAEQLSYLASELKAGELWVVIDGAHVSVIGEGELGAAGLAKRLELATHVVDALER